MNRTTIALLGAPAVVGAGAALLWLARGEPSVDGEEHAWRDTARHPPSFVAPAAPALTPPPQRHPRSPDGSATGPDAAADAGPASAASGESAGGAPGEQAPLGAGGTATGAAPATARNSPDARPAALAPATPPEATEDQTPSAAAAVAETAIRPGPRDPACVPGPLTAPVLTGTDVVVTIDTSGSMVGLAPEVSAWLATKFVPALRAVDPDARLIVVADLRRLDRYFPPRDPRPRWTPSAAGINIPLPVDSKDSLDVLLASAVNARPTQSWLSAVRPQASLHFVIATDDDPKPSSARDFSWRLAELTAGAQVPRDPPFRLHALLGYDPKAGPLVLAPDAPPAGGGCGRRPGVDYQTLAQDTGGLRASLCSREALDEFARTFAAQLQAEGGGRCRAPLPEGIVAERIASVRAVNGAGMRYELTRVALPTDCPGQLQAYGLTGRHLILCPDSCAALARAGAAQLELMQRCE